MVLITKKSKRCNDMVKLRFLITSLSGGGAEKALINVLKQLDPTEYQVSITALFGGVYANKIPDYVNRKIIFKKNNLLCRLLIKLPPKLLAWFFLRGNYDFEVAYLEGWPTKVVAALHTNAQKIAFVHCDISVRNPLQKLYRSKKTCLKEYKQYNTRSVLFPMTVNKGLRKLSGNLITLVLCITCKTTM